MDLPINAQESSANGKCLSAYLDNQLDEGSAGIGTDMTQARRLENHCTAMGHADVEVITDLGTGMNFRKKGLRRLVRLILIGQAGRIVVVTRDRLLRFGNDLLFDICAFFGVEVEVLDADPQATRERKLTEDLVEILTAFSSRMYGAQQEEPARN